ncbi:ABC transporter ATP-binding protein [Oceaniglobus roseus]|uniref:ABC transporter ATP-binding protein n=1 Tax=Oceaniglobus roseus TaxID=1737570 RepID=UPI000C7E8D93|nr:ABC transporter ATP-binding protein [Kandeliimicrobium roseum]
MIQLENLTKVYWARGGRKVIADNVNVTFPDRTAVALLGRNGAGKSTLLEMIAGSREPTSGRILSTGEISWPVGFSGSFHPELTGAQNVRFVARIYGADADATMRFVADFAELGGQFHMPFRSYSSGMRSRLAFGLSMSIDFDTYLIDEVTSVGDQSFRDKSVEFLQDRMRTSAAIMVSHNPSQIRRICNAGAVLEEGTLTYYEDLEEALDQHERNMARHRRTA